MEVIHFRLVRIEPDPNLGPPSGEVGEESFQFRVIFDNDGNIININECVRVLGDQTLDQQLIFNSEQERGAKASFYDAPRGFETNLFSLYVRVCVRMCIDRAESGHIVWREPCMVQMENMTSWIVDGNALATSNKTTKGSRPSILCLWRELTKFAACSVAVCKGLDPYCSGLATQSTRRCKRGLYNFMRTRYMRSVTAMGR